MRTALRAQRVFVSGTLFRLVLLSMMLSACAKRYPVAGAPVPEADADPGSVFVSDVPLRIENRFYGDVVIYIERGGIRTRLATVTAATTRSLMIPKRYFEILTPLRLVGEGIGAASGGQRVTTATQNLLVRPGQQIVWTLETQLERSNVGIY